MSNPNDPRWKAGIDIPPGWDQDAPTCATCGLEMMGAEDGVCRDCHTDAGEVFCALCAYWAKGTADSGAPESPICDECMQEIAAEANRVDDGHRYMESA